MKIDFDIKAATSLELPPSLNLTLQERTKDQCAYIAGEPVGGCYCGHPVQAGSSFCKPHHALCWRAPIERKAGGRR